MFYSRSRLAAEKEIQNKEDEAVFAMLDAKTGTIEDQMRRMQEAKDARAAKEAKEKQDFDDRWDV